MDISHRAFGDFIVFAYMSVIMIVVMSIWMIYHKIQEVIALSIYWIIAPIIISLVIIITTIIDIRSKYLGDKK